MNNMVTINYRDFYDVPRVFLVTYRDVVFLFDCPFNDSLDDYPPEYVIYLMPKLRDEELADSWNEIQSRAIRKIGQVPVASVMFDESRRKEMSTEVLERIGRHAMLWQ